MTLSMQWLTMAVMLLSGLGMGTVFDGYRVVTNELRFPRWWLPVLDVIYWIAAGLIVFRVLYASNNGEVRAYVFIGLAIGIVIYYFLLSRFVIAIVKWMIGAVRKLIGFILKCLEILVVKPILLLYKVLMVIFAFGSALTIFILKIVIQLVRPFWKLFVWMAGPATRPLGRWLSRYASKWQLNEKASRLGQQIARLWGKWFRR
ncbi:spore cortex biosynthesis protein YabQ [Paenibacillus endophyticus]|uniref:Spore cortex biosynthesis protein YabQ n=1 Tax=Paenibacillus endophyticus TaxID=1294268 RepID=A0A7W5CE93_9BACL|nr:spore cortex biosynthesis protein YabQ [Paenibacillus endophyticus]MBB3156081.1 spore cortex biosynthesis protein YabQ [Paenibacillus endophyticus]